MVPASATSAAVATPAAAACSHIAGRVREASLAGIHVVLDDPSPVASHVPQEEALGSPFGGTVNVLPISTTVVTLARGREVPAAGDHVSIDGYVDGSYFVAERISEFASPVQSSPAVCPAGR